jgi:restriction endonuclease S subunit
MVATFDHDNEAIFGGFVIRVRLDSTLAPLVACAMFQTPSIRRMIVESAGTGTITNINQPALMALPIVVPSLSCQTKFVELLLTIEGVLLQQNEAMAKAEAIFESLLAREFLRNIDPLSAKDKFFALQDLAVA